MAEFRQQKAARTAGSNRRMRETMAKKNSASTWKEWGAQGDDFRTFLGAFAVALLQIEFPELSLLASSRLTETTSTKAAQGAPVS